MPDGKIESTRNFTLIPELQAPPTLPRCFLGPSPLRPLSTGVVRDWPHTATDVQQTAQGAKPKIKAPSKLKITRH